jgi:hypothetical protein
MVEAGVREFYGYDPRVESPEEVVRAIYAAMRASIHADDTRLPNATGG